MKSVNFVVLIFLFLISSINGFSQDDEIIRVDSSLVVLNATITDSTGKPLKGLKKDQFSIFENGKQQEISLFETASTPFAAVILIDTSGSMEQRISMARSAAIRFLAGLRTEDMVAIYTFDSKVSLVQDFSGSRDIADTAYNLKANGMTVLNDAIYKAAGELIQRPEKRRAIIVLSDGADTQSKYSSDRALKAALSADATIYTVDMSSPDTRGIARIQSQGALKNFAEKTGGNFVATPGGTALREAFKNIVDELGTQYTLGYQPSNNERDGKWRAIDLKVSSPEAQTRTRKGYHAPKGK